MRRYVLFSLALLGAIAVPGCCPTCMIGPIGVMIYALARAIGVIPAP